MASHRIAVLPGDGIGQEVIAAGSEVLRALAAREPGLELELRPSTGARPGFAPMAG